MTIPSCRQDSSTPPYIFFGLGPSGTETILVSHIFCCHFFGAAAATHAPANLTFLSFFYNPSQTITEGGQVFVVTIALENNTGLDGAESHVTEDMSSL